MKDLCKSESRAHAADGLSVCVSLLLDLQKLSSLDQRLQSFLGTAVCQLPLCQPLFQLPDSVPDSREISSNRLLKRDLNDFTLLM